MCQRCESSNYGVLDTGVAVTKLSLKTGLLTEYHKTESVYFVSHLATPPTSDSVLAELNRRLAVDPDFDGWADKVVIVSRPLGDSIRFDTYMAATETTVGQQGHLIGTIAAIVIIAFFAIIAVSMAYFAWVLLQLAYVAKDAFTGQYIDNRGRVWKSKEELFYALRQDYWLVCPKCLLCVADKVTYPTYESIPADMIAKFEDHVANCPGAPGPEPNWMLFGVIAIVAVGVIYIGGKMLGIFGKSGERITVLR